MNFEKIIQAMEGFYNEFIAGLEVFLPKLLGAVIILLIGWLLAWITKALLTRLIRRVEQMTMNEKMRARLNKLRIENSLQLVIKAVYWLIIILAVTVATELLGLPVLTTWLSGLLKYFPNILVAIILIILGLIGGRILGDFIVTSSATVSFMYRNFLGRFIQYAIVAVSILIAINQIGIDISLIVNMIDIILAALLFGAAFAFGLGAQTSVSNILASYYLLRSYKVGQHVRIEGVEGKISEINAHVVQIETSEGVVLIPPKKFSEVISIRVNKE